MQITALMKATDGVYIKMVAIPEYGDPTLRAMERAIEAAHNAKEKRTYLGASVIGNPCVRQIWYEYNGFPKEAFTAKTLMNFEDGHRTEELTAQRLRLIPGVELITHNDKGEQIGFAAFGGKFRGHCDGIITGLIQAPKAPHIWECKASSQKKYDEFIKAKKDHGEKGALKAWNENYFIQGQLYMHFLGCERHYLTVALAGGREYQSCRTDYMPEVAAAAIDRAQKIIEAQQPPPRINEKPDFFICKWCAFKDICHGNKT